MARDTFAQQLSGEARSARAEAAHEALHDSVYLPAILAARAAKLADARRLGVGCEGLNTEWPYEPRIYREPVFD